MSKTPTKQPGMVPPSTSAAAAAPAKADLGSSLSQLFDKKEEGNLGGSFGMGGLLGLRHGVPKMPSFRVITTFMI